VSTAAGRVPIDEFARLVRLHDERLRALAYHLLGDPHWMDDALQDAYAKAFRSYAGFRGESDPGTWLYRIVHNACVDLL
jgi:RNA polymerase sigma-70 factor, ECF subfamily